MSKIHDFDAAWKSILETFEREITELLFPELYDKIAWEQGTESLDKELQEIQKEIFDKESSEKIISDKILKVNLKKKGSKILFIHVEVQSYISSDKVFGERMFRYFYRIWDKFRYKYDDKSEIVAAAIYTYKGSQGKDERYVYKLPELKEDILVYNFRTIDVENITLDGISEDNPLKLVFKMAKSLLNTKFEDNDIFKAKIELAEELSNYNKIKNDNQIKALVDFLEYLFLIEDPELASKYDAYKREKGGKFKMSIEEIRRIHYTEAGKAEGKAEGKLEGKTEGRKEKEEETRQRDAKRVIKLLTKRFKGLDNTLEKKIMEASSEKLNLINEEILDINDLEDVEKILDGSDNNGNVG